MTSRASLFATFAVAACVARAGDAPQRVTFDASLLRGARSGAVDLSAFEHGASIVPGEFDVEIVRNGVPMGRRRVRFDDAEGVEGAAPIACVDRALAAWLEVATARLAHVAPDASDADACTPIERLHPAARAEFDVANLTLHVSMPQALLRRRDDAIDPATLDAGIPALRVNYAASVIRQPGDPDAQHAGLHVDAGANAGAWRWRHRGSHTWSTSRERRSQVLASTLERDVSRFDARLTFGDLFVSGAGFDAIGLRGVHFRSDDRMVPPDATRPAPVIRGTADTHARVQVRQAGLLLLDVPVPPGPFALEQVRPMARDGALQVHIEEADGRTRSFEMPWATLPGLLPEGRARFDLVAGLRRAEDGGRGDAPVFQGGIQRGLRDRLTLRAGAQLASDYAQSLTGAVFASRFGAMSLDRAHARSTSRGVRTVGASTRLHWSTRFAPTRTHFDLGAWFRADAGHRSLHEAMRARRSTDHRDPPLALARIEASVHQAFGAQRHGVRLALVERRFELHDNARSLQLAWAVPMRPRGMQLHALLEHTRGNGPDASTQATLSFSVPLQVRAEGPPTFLQAHARAGPDDAALQADVSGAFGEHAHTAWRAGLAKARRGDAIASASLSRSGSAGHVASGWSTSAGRHRWSASGHGSVVAHPHGVTFGPPLGETAALVRAQHGAGARLLHAPQLRLDRHGRALAPHLSPYRRNRVGIDPLGAAAGVAFDWTERDVVPRAGALVDVVLPSTLAATRFVRVVVDASGTPASFGARIVDATQATRGLVGRDGLTWLDADDDLPLALHRREGEDVLQCTLAASPDAKSSNPDALATLACVD
ncbi:fimbrial biogenesis outer membrane usher protein [Lysobacter sp. A6]|uniref:Fimbrial biogenesis outer membrane usher protein n=1 Tax=Noviluteimonas lactosilytica TaxID=2888523 RepID=A0ABS8JLQ6_9GAMM|nr:fimbria/pilus outer membrane usher protein [Lysobacter lactosilyticus]MCC8364550.1 fimbrial biogenesis outer membrane usher protein [Lysobacter lactosilyticus]